MPRGQRSMDASIELVEDQEACAMVERQTQCLLLKAIVSAAVLTMSLLILRSSAFGENES